MLGSSSPNPTAGVKSLNTTPSLNRHVLSASIPHGPGAAPFPSLDHEPPYLSEQAIESPLAWSSIYFSPHNLCEEFLSNEVPRQYQVIVVSRGGCSFSEKLHHIPAFPPSSKALQLVIIVSHPGSTFQTNGRKVVSNGDSKHSKHDNVEDDADFIQPYLDREQFTPAGLPRPHPIPMILLPGGQGSLNLLKKAKGIALRRRWWFESQGIRIHNLIVL
jgi:hypothetical protein